MSKNGYRTSSFQAKRAASQAYCRGRNQQALCPDLVMQKSHPRPCKYPGTIKVKIRHNLTHPPIHQKKKSDSVSNNRAANHSTPLTNKRQRTTGNSTDDSDRASNTQCWNCGLHGHRQLRCPYKIKPGRRPVCSKLGHESFLLGGRRRIPTLPWNINSQQSPRNSMP
jgi:hypothetical protein